MRLVQDYLPKELDVEESIVEGVFPSLMKAHFEFIIQRPPSIPIRPTTHHKENLVQRLQKLKHLTVTIEPRQEPDKIEPANEWAYYTPQSKLPFQLPYRAWSCHRPPPVNRCFWQITG